MNILLANTFHYNRGGDSTYTFNLTNLLEKDNENNVLHFAMKHPMNYLSRYSEFFVPEIDLPSELSCGGLKAGIRVLKRTIYSTESKYNLSKLLDRYRVDIAHIQNINRYITPSIFHTLKSRNIPIVWTLHDYFLICPNSHFFNKDKVCELCKGYRFFNGVFNRCRKGSIAASMVVVLEEYLHRLFGLVRMVDYFITPSKFLRNKFIEYSFPPQKLIHIPNFVDATDICNSPESGNYALYSGRLSQEKGVFTLIDAVSLCKGMNLLIAGEGSLRKQLEDIANMKAPGKVKFLGRLDKEKLYKLISGCMFVVVPSLWYENSPYSVLEAFASCKPVVASRIGGIPELVEEGRSGLLFEPGCAQDLASKIQWMFDNPKKVRDMGKEARELVDKVYNSEIHRNCIIEVYKRALKDHGY